ncbi:DUF5979 domain-containing protein [Agromyces soli]|uniref:DUF5979 domain-containing protein n=1 Tax=Agromyces soli TaxID=659012 RepID=A0ABY4AUP5_9MICO|nr:DUF5979 domain-containing protein [Agromyces soli]UOE26569.1 DUF5979 domain-containing protein [Agromyces soli]
MAVSRRIRRILSGGIAILVGAALAIPLGAMPAQGAEVTSVLEVRKQASVTEVHPGDVFSYTVQVSCSSLTDTGCEGAVLTDAVPAPFVPISAAVSGASADQPTISGSDVSATFTQDLGNGRTGLLDNTTATVTITVKAPDELPYDLNGVPITNTATATATNAEQKQSSVNVTTVVDFEPGTEATKTIEPPSAVAAPGTPLTVAVGGTNTSNGSVDRIVISDPADPSQPGAFDLLALQSVDSVSYPEGADTAVLSYWDPVTSTWVPGPPATAPAVPGPPAAPAPADAGGFRVEFTNSTGEATIPAGAQAGVSATMVQGEGVADLTEATTVPNTSSSTVGRGDDESSGTADDDYRIVLDPVVVAADKRFTPSEVLPGETSQVDLTATNAGETELDRMTVTDPASGDFTSDAAFDGFTGPIGWPDGADAATLVYRYSDGTTSPVLDLEAGVDPPAPDPTKTVAGFAVEFTGTITEGAEATISFDVATDPSLVGPLTIPNTVGVEGEADGSTASDEHTAELTVLEKKLAVGTTKKISPGSIPSVAGELATVQLPTQLLKPDSTTSATQIVVQDPATIPDPGWWNSFDVVAITKTDIPPGATLTVSYWSISQQQWVVFDGADHVTTPNPFSMTVPPELRDDIGGLQFQFDDPNGFPPGTTVQPNFTSALRDQLRDGSGPAAGSDEPVPNCASAGATAPGVDPGSATTPEPCPTIDLIPGEGGTGDLIDKAWVDPVPAVVIARSGEQATARLNWSTGGYSNLDRVVVADTADPPADDAAIAATVFQAFDLVEIAEITNDPWLQYDRVTAVELWNGSAWVPTETDPCAGSACDGAFPGYRLSDAERASTTGVRLVFEEYPAPREASDAPIDAPLPGSGVARSSGNDRPLDLVFELRDLVRVPSSDPDPVLGTRPYNTATPGDVDNTASATGYVDDEQFVRDTAADVISIIDRPLNTTVTKGWTGGALGIPPAGTAETDYPSGRVTIIGTNATVAQVDTLSVSDPSPGQAAPTAFDEFNLKRIVSVSVPGGTVTARVFLTRASGAVDEMSIDAATGLGAAALADVVGIEVVHQGRIAAGDSTRLVMDLQLRATHRTGGAPVTAVDSPVQNTAQSVVEDLGGVNGEHRVTDDDDALMRLAQLEIGVVAGKTFSPQGQLEPNRNPITMTLSARPTGSARASELVVVDEEPRFWNAFDFVDFASNFTLATPITRVQVDAFTGASFTAEPDGSLSRSGGAWVTGSPGTTPQLPAGVQPEDVQGLRFTFTRADGAQWENPANPLQQMPLLVQRRLEFRSGGDVRTDLVIDGNTPAPGETELGTFTNDVQATANSFLKNGSGDPLYTKSASAEAQARYLHYETSVAVTKGPQGVQLPGAPIPFTLEVMNTGTAPITNPVVTDRIPMQDGEPLLVFDPMLVGSPYSYALEGDPPDPANGTPMPTDPADVTTDVAADGSSIVFSFPPGTVLEAGQTYTITVLLMFRPGVEAGQQVENGFDVTADRPFDFCEGRPGPRDTCADTTIVYPADVGAMRAVKLVRADDGLGVTNVEDPSASGDCTPVVAGFYDAPCVPITKPGSTETWLVAGQNTGTIAADRAIAVDRLPTPGDGGALVDLPRGSQWAPVWVGNATTHPFPGGRVPDSFEVFGTSDANPCVVELQDPAAVCPPGAWTPIDELDPATVTSVKFVMAFTSALLQPGEAAALTFQTRSPAVSPTAGPDTIAWNTAATGGSSPSSYVLPSEGRRVGVALATGPIQVVKRVTGDGAAFAPEEFQVQLSCTSAIGTPVETVLPPIELTLVADEVQTVEDLPWGAECELSEVPGENGETSSASTTAVVGRDTDPVGLVELENVYELAGLALEKQVTSSAVDQDGEPVSYGPFAFEVSCSYLGEEVVADGYPAGQPMAVELADGERVELTGLPAGAVCSVEETGTKGATGTTLTVTEGDGPPESGPGTQVDVTLPPVDAEGQPTVLVEADNAFDVGTVVIEKVADGPGAEDFGQGPFTLHLECVLSDDSGIRTVWDGDLVLPTPEGEWSTEVDGIAAGASCTVTEPDPGLADEVAISPDGPFLVGAETPVEVTVTNTFLAGSLHVVKQRTGDGAERYGAGPFTVSLACTLPLEGGPVPVDIPGGAERVLNAANGYEADYEPLPARAECELSEPGTGGANDVRITDEDGEPGATFVVEPGVERSFTVTNVFELGAIEVVKTVTGSGAAAAADRTFTVQLTCVRDDGGEGVQIAIPGGATRTLSKATSLTTVYEELPTGAACELVETDAAGAARTTLTPHVDDPRTASVIVGSGDAVRIDVVNEFDAAPPIARTGVDPLPIALVAGGILLAGGAVLAIVLIRRRRQR